MIKTYWRQFKDCEPTEETFNPVQLESIVAKSRLQICGYVSREEALEQVNSWNRQGQKHGYMYWII